MKSLKHCSTKHITDYIKSNEDLAKTKNSLETYSEIDSKFNECSKFYKGFLKTKTPIRGKLNIKSASVDKKKNLEHSEIKRSKNINNDHHFIDITNYITENYSEEKNPIHNIFQNKMISSFMQGLVLKSIDEAFMVNENDLNLEKFHIYLFHLFFSI